MSRGNKTGNRDQNSGNGQLGGKFFTVSKENGVETHHPTHPNSPETAEYPGFAFTRMCLRSHWIKVKAARDKEWSAPRMQKKVWGKETGSNNASCQKSSSPKRGRRDATPQTWQALSWWRSPVFFLGGNQKGGGNPHIAG